jgi:hypothetical protein
LTLIVCEIGLLVLEGYQQRKMPDFGDVVRKQGLGFGGYLKESVSISSTDGYGGSVTWQNNAAGFRSDREYSPRPALRTLRILSIGDSFAVGYRMGQEETYAAQLEKWLNGNIGSVEVLIAGVEDPVTALYYLQHFGIKYQPHVVLLEITLGNDIAQSYIALDERGTYSLTEGKEGIWIEEKHPSNPLGFLHGLETQEFPSEYRATRGTSQRVAAKISSAIQQLRIVRLVAGPEEPIMTWYGDPDRPNPFDPTAGLGAFAVPPLPIVEEAYRRAFRAIGALKSLCDQRGIHLVVLLAPQRFQVQPPDWEAAISRYGLNPSHFDLMAPNTRFAEFCSRHGIYLIDPTTAMAEEYIRSGGKTLHFPRGNMHWNSQGQRAFFDAIRTPLGKILSGNETVPTN